MSGTNLYETLGVSEDASLEEIKQAFRKKAAQSHPDHGGSDADMADLNLAYSTLSNPRARLEYDSSGATPQPDDGMDQAKEVVLIVFNNILRSKQRPDADFVLMAAKMITDKIKSLRGDERNLRAIIQQLRHRRKRVVKTKKRGDVNLWTVLVDREIKNVRKDLGSCKTEIQANRLALDILKDYEGRADELAQQIASYDNDAADAFAIAVRNWEPR